jgi:hypothetical protein
VRFSGGRALRVGRGLTAAGAMLALAGCAGTPSAPANLGVLKQELRAQVARGEHDRAIGRVAAEAARWLEARAVRGEAGLAVVFDLDETLLSNWPHMAEMDFGYVPSAWQAWVDAGKAPAIGPVRDVFLLARRLGLEVILLTGRTERDREGTERNLRAIGCADYQRLILAPEGERRTAEAFKTEERRRLVAEGKVIIANLGDQESDLCGGFAERTFKLPNPFYLTP